MFRQIMRISYSKNCDKYTYIIKNKALCSVQGLFLGDYNHCSILMPNTILLRMHSHTCPIKVISILSLDA